MKIRNAFRITKLLKLITDKHCLMSTIPSQLNKTYLNTVLNIYIIYFLC